MEMKCEDVISVCTICCQQIRKVDVINLHPKFQPAEKLMEVFEVFFKYMSWEKSQLKFNFLTESFPFCESCKATVISVYRMHGIVENILNEIHQIKTDVLARLLYSSSKNEEVDVLCNSVDDGNRLHLKKVKQLRKYAFSLCSPTVTVEQIKSLDGGRVREVPKYEPIEVQTVEMDDSCYMDDISENIENDGNDEMNLTDVEDEDGKEKAKVKEEFSTSSRNVRRFQDIGTKGKKIEKMSVTFGEALYRFDFDGLNYKCSFCKFTASTKVDLLKHAGKTHFTKPAEIEKSQAKEQSEIVMQKWKPVTKKSKVVFGKKFREQVHQIDEKKFIFDEKYPFELNSNNRWICTTCDKEFFSRYTLQHHFLVRKCKGHLASVINPVAVQIVDEEESASDSENEEIYLLYDKFPVTRTDSGWKCGSCNKLFGGKHPIQQHVLADCKGKNNDIDRSCVETEKNKFLYSQNFPFEFLNGKYKCGTCGVFIKLRERMLAHIGRTHIERVGRDRNHMVEVSPNQFLYANKFYAEKDGDLFRCCSCDFTTKKRHTLTSHLYNKHLEDKKYMCDTCGKGFQMMCQLRIHQMRVHKGDKYYKKAIHVCDICGKLLSTKADWTGHTDEHSDVNAVGVPCQVCGKFLYRHKMRDHMKTHNQSHECTDCNKKFASKWYLSVHLKTHGGAKPFSCDICDARFAQKGSVRKHKLIKHDFVDEDTD